MPTIKGNAAAATANALEGVKFSVIPNSGAMVNMWISCAANGGTFGLGIGDRDIVIPNTEANVEIAADVIDVSRDQVVFNELVGPGQLYLPIGAAGTEIQWQLHIRYL